MRKIEIKTVADTELFKNQIFQWSQQFREVVFLDSNSFPDKHSQYDLIVAVDSFTSLQTDYFNAFDELKNYQQATKDWLFGYLTYDLKNDIEPLISTNFDGLQFPDLFFFQPKKLFLLKNKKVEIAYLNCCDDELASDFEEIEKTIIAIEVQKNAIKINQRISKENYIEKVSKMLAHIQRGDIYEANFCMEFYSENTFINPATLYLNLNKISEPPFATYFKKNHHYLLSASPERYLQKIGDHLISQPIKGTSKRFAEDDLDELSKNNLKLNPKERSENIMIVDLVRNDLSRTAQKGSVEVTELCEVYSFKQVHQLISTITSKIKNDIPIVEVIKTTFPMGSMTGAPKISAMKIIEYLEETKRGLYSGAVGYFTPNGDFDFNVIIRSILYNSNNKYVSFSVGSAITNQSDPELEYEECMLKAKAMFNVLQ